MARRWCETDAGLAATCGCCATRRATRRSPSCRGASAAQPSAEEEKEDTIPLQSLGSTFYWNRVWLFDRTEAAKKLNKEGATQRRLRVNVGARGAEHGPRLLRVNQLNRDDIVRSNLELTPAVVALLGETSPDALAMVSAPESQLVQMLMQTPGIRLYLLRAALRPTRAPTTS